MEHPDVIEGPHGQDSKEAPSVWFLEQLQRLRLLPTITIHHTPHANYGGYSVKPTRIMAVRLGSVATRLKEWQRVVKAVGTLKGKDEKGAWRTSRAKEYPRHLSAAIALAMTDAIKIIPVSFKDKCVDFAKHIKAYMPQLRAQVSSFGADFVDNPLPIGTFSTGWEPPWIW